MSPLGIGSIVHGQSRRAAIPVVWSCAITIDEPLRDQYAIGGVFPRFLRESAICWPMACASGAVSS